MGERIKVFARARPLTDNELDSQEASIIQPEHLPNDNKLNQFLWSVDGFSKDGNGLLIPTSEKYADEEKVFALIKPDILASLNSGRNFCLFTYGQAESGKSYSISSDKTDPGIIYNFINLIIEKTQNKENSNTPMSMYKTNSEKIFDLFEPQSKKKKTRSIGNHIQIEGLKKEKIASLRQAICFYNEENLIQENEVFRKENEAFRKKIEELRNEKVLGQEQLQKYIKEIEKKDQKLKEMINSFLSILKSSANLLEIVRELDITDEATKYLKNIEKQYKNSEEKLKENLEFLRKQ